MHVRNTQLRLIFSQTLDQVAEKAVRVSWQCRAIKRFALVLKNNPQCYERVRERLTLFTLGKFLSPFRTQTAKYFAFYIYLALYLQSHFHSVRSGLLNQI